MWDLEVSLCSCKGSTIDDHVREPVDSLPETGVVCACRIEIDQFAKERWTSAGKEASLIWDDLLRGVDLSTEGNTFPFVVIHEKGNLVEATVLVGCIGMFTNKNSVYGGSEIII